jgi:trehalose-6-phosphate synthase
MSPEERNARMQRMRKLVKEGNIYRWAGNLIGDVYDVRLKVSVNRKEAAVLAPASPLVQERCNSLSGRRVWPPATCSSVC